MKKTSCLRAAALPRIALFLVAVFCAQAYAWAQADSLRKVIQTAKDDTTRLMAYHALFIDLKRSDEPEAIKKCLADYLAAAQKAGDAYHVARAYLDLADFDFDSADVHLEHVFAYANATPNDKRAQRLGAMANLYKGDNLYYVGEYDKALPYLRRAEQLMPDDEGKGGVYASLGQVLSEQSKMAEALECFKKCREIGLKTGNKYLQAKSLKYIGDIYETLGDGAQAVDCLKKAIGVYAEINNKPGVMASLASIAWVYAKSDSTRRAGLESFRELIQKAEEAKHDGFVVWAKYGLAYIYTELGEAEKALDFGAQALQQAKGMSEEDYMKWHVLPTMARAHNRQKDYAKALQCAQEAQAVFQKANASDSEISQAILLEMAHAQIGLGQTETGWKNLERYLQEGNELSLAKVKDQIASAEAQFRVNEHEFALAESQRANQLQAEKAATQRNIYLGLLAGLGLFLAFGLFSYRRAQRDKALISSQKEQLEQSLGEKETLLKEIHHRVKNNLQIISGLLEKQARKTTDDEAKKLMKEGQDRVFSMALVHQNLYQSDNLSAIEIRNYLEALTKNIEASQAAADQKIEVRLDVDDSTLDIDTAIPVALILNELITNCFKYAFRGRASGLVQVGFHRRDDAFFLKVSDNGVGLAADFDLSKSKSLGLNLVRGLTRQLGGQFDFGRAAGETFFAVQFARA